ncbi:ABC transporter substrate-binding protein [Cobetia amphilecti]|uniref:ABC transporter substrate-binding protein n=1 Tax=Cobetia amphilecti TaxID=1055104 RepID=UPI00337C2161
MVKLLSRLRWQYRTFLHDRRQLAVASVALSLAVVQPSHAQDASAAQASAADTRRLEIVAPFDIKGADPLLSGILFQRMQIVETLVEMDATGELQPGLATDWEVSDDGLEWRFTLRSGVQFHDGSQLDAEVARQVLEIASAKPGLLKSVPVERIVAEDAQTLVIALSEPFAALPAYLADYRQQILAPAAFDETGTAQQVIGTGPYRMLRMTPPLSLEVTAFEDYWGPQPEVRQARYQAVSRAEGRALIAESGDADFTYGLDPASRQRLSQSPRVTLAAAATPRTMLLKVNANHPAFQDPAVRRALSLAIDRTAIAQVVLRYPRGASQLFPPMVEGWHDPALPELHQDVAKARALLDAAGWKVAEDGIRHKDGQRLAISLITFSDRPELPLVATVLERQFHAIGIQTRLDITNFSAIPAGHHDGSLDMALFARNLAMVPDPIGNVLSDYAGTPEAPGGDWGAMGWFDADFTAELERMAREGYGPTPAGQDPRARASGVIQRALPVIPIAWYYQNLAISYRLQSAQVDPWERSFGLSELRWAQ